MARVPRGASSAPALRAVELPDLAVEILGLDERRELRLGDLTVGLEHLRDERRIRSAPITEAHHVARDVPLEGTAERVLEVIPDETAVHLEQVGQ